MKFAKRLLMVAGAISLTGLFGAMLAPRAAHAVVSTLVTVVNSVAVVNPTVSGGAIQGVVTEETDGASRQPVAFHCGGQSLSNQSGFVPCVPQFYTVPTGKRLVIEFLDSFCFTPNGNNIDLIALDVTTAGTPIFRNFGLVREALSDPTARFDLAQPLRLYADPGTAVTPSFQMDDSTGSTSCNIQFSGYLEPANVQ